MMDRIKIEQISECVMEKPREKQKRKKKMHCNAGHFGLVIQSSVALSKPRLTWAVVSC